ncbi:MAG: hypothetical protein IPL64_09265 [Flavobacteriales bacterium]|jgi:hypothetical protein|nr:hypothetical protein [Flavobacteriales bacterium]MBK7101160.1 hypothetical protein [Flavobacteriales bacterium]MBK8532070.1 hypothetical protein [Flavobacteriales bacterium]MBP9177753.1 hypothetical protein [Flavobacteriales bacterium]
MTDRCFCTIITRSHVGWALALATSLRQWDTDLPFVILITDVDAWVPDALKGMQGIEVVHMKDVAPVSVGAQLAAKYAQESDVLRWTMKPVLMSYLHQRYEKVMYGDCDLHFFADPVFLWEQLDEADMLLSPHWRSGKASVDRDNFDMLFTEGLYNGGFVAAHRNATEPLRRWAENCLEVCVKDTTKGQYVDQTHLNILPVYYDRVYPLKHRGCNVANWNMVECVRSGGPNGEVLINGSFPIVFIHFTRSMIDGIVSGMDPLLMPHLEILRDRLLAGGFGTDIIAASHERLRVEREAANPGWGRRIGSAVKRIARVK